MAPAYHDAARRETAAGNHSGRSGGSPLAERRGLHDELTAEPAFCTIGAAALRHVPVSSRRISLVWGRTGDRLDPSCAAPREAPLNQQEDLP